MSARTKLSRRLTERLPLSSVVMLLIGTTIGGQVLGFLRTKLVNANFPLTGPHSTDAYFAAFQIPDFFFFTLAAGALGVAFMPVLSDRLHKGDKKGVWQLSASLMNLLTIVMAVVGVIIFVFASPLIKHVVAPGLSPEQTHQAVVIMRFLAFNPLLFSITGVLTAAQQTLGRFFFYAIAPLFYNITIIISIFVFRDNIGLAGLGVGALIGAVLQLIVVATGLFKTNYHWYRRILWKSPDFRTILRQLPPRGLDQGMDQLNGIVETRFASRLGSGSVSYYSNAFILHTAPILLLGTAISTAAFPQLNARLSQNRPDLFRRDFIKILKTMIWLTAPVIVISFFARGYLARLIFTQGSPTIALIFGYLTVAIFFRIIYTIISRWFYAQKDSKTPLYVSVFTIGFNIVLAYFLSKPDNYNISGLAIAQSIVAMTEVFILFVIMAWRDHKLFGWDFLVSMGRVASVSGFAIIVGYIIVSLFPLGAADRGFVTLGSKLALISLVILSTHILVSWIFGIDEAMPFINRIKKFILKPIRLT